MSATAALPAGWTATVHDRIAAISASDWNACAGHDSPYVRHEHLLALEASGVAVPQTGFTPRPVLVRDASGAVVGAAPAWLKTHSNGELGVDLGLALAHARAVGPYYPKLQIEVPMTPIAGTRLLVRAGQDESATRAALLAALKGEAERCDAASLQIAYMAPPDRAATAAFGMTPSEGNAYVWRAGGESSFEALLQRMHSRRRRMIQRERRAVAAYGLVYRRIAGDELDAAWAERFHALYATTFARRGQDAWLNVDYFRRLFRNLPGAVELLVAFDGATCVAALLFVRGRTTLYGQHWGQSGQRELLHFELAFYRALERAIELGVERLDLGTTGRHKAPRGIGIEATHHAAWFRAPAFRAIAVTGLARKCAAAAAERAAETARLPFAAVAPAAAST
jgi:hypothetical protein